jgi:hypothetical protein
MTIGDFINDPFGAVAKAGLDAAPDEVRETLHDVKESVTNPTLPDSSSLINSFSAGTSEAQSTVPDVGGFTSGEAASDPMGASGEIDSGSVIPDVGSFFEDQGLDVPDLSGVDVRNSLDIITDDKENWDTSGQMEQSQPYVDTSAPEIVHPDPYADGPSQGPTAGELAQDSGAGAEIDDMMGGLF